MFGLITPESFGFGGSLGIRNRQTDSCGLGGAGGNGLLDSSPPPFTKTQVTAE